MSERGERTVIVAGLAAGGIHLAARMAENGFEFGAGQDPRNMRIMVGTFLMIALLLLMAEFWPDAAASIAIIVLVTSLVINGGDFFKLINSLVEG